MRRNLGIAAVLGLFAILLAPCAFATAPIAKEIPDIRHAINGAGDTDVVLDLDDYVLDPDDRNQNTSAQNQLTWGEDGTNTAVLSPTNTLEVTVPASAAPVSADVTFDVSDATDTVFVGPVRVHTTLALLSAPLVDTQLGAGSGGAVPYGWCAQEGAGGTGFVRVDISQSGADPITGDPAIIDVNITTGAGEIELYGASTLLTDATAQNNPLAPYDDGVALKGWDKSGTGTNPVNPSIPGAANLSVDANASGVFITPQAFFSDWVRITVTRDYSDGSDDSYTIAVGDMLTGQVGNIQGPTVQAVVNADVPENYSFDGGVTVTDLIGVASSAAFNGGTDTDRRNALLAQKTNWLLIVPGMNVATGATTGSLPDIAITSTDKPASTYPGATKDRALKATFNSPAGQGILMSHKGIPQSQYAPGDVVTFSLNAYVDLAYDGVNDDLINEPTSGLAFALGLATLPVGLAQNVNYLYFAPRQADYLPLTRGQGGNTFGRGGSQSVNPFPVINGKWTRQEVSMRIPEVGQNVAGPSGSGDTLDPVGLQALLLLSRVDASGDLPNQTVWLDNFCITRCPGALALAQGASNVPMVSAGFAPAFNNGNDSGPGAAFIAAGFYGDIPIPAAITRGTAIYGSFSQGSGGAEAVTGRAPTTVWGADVSAGHSDAVNNAKAGFLEGAANTDLAVIASGALDIALGFPTLDAGNRAAAIGPAPNANVGNDWTSSLTPAAGSTGSLSLESPYLDMRASNEGLLPGLHVADVSFPGTGGGADGDNGYLNPDQILGNVSGVFGLRWFTKSNAANVNHNPRLDAVLVSADFVLGLVATRNSPALPSADNAGFTSTVWVDDFISGSFLTFNSYQKYYDLVLNSQVGGRAGMQSAGTTALANALLAENPGAQLAWVQFLRSNGAAAGTLIKSIVDNANAIGFDGIYSTTGNPVTNTDALPGRYSSAVLSIDEANLYAARDASSFFDEDLNRSDLN